MAVLYIYENPHASLDIYDRVSAQLRAEGAPAGSIHHIAAEREGGGILVVEVWENEEAHDKFDKVIREKIAAAGGPPRVTPRKMPVRNMMSNEEARA